MGANLLTVRYLDPDFGAGRLLTHFLKLLLCVVLISPAVFAEKYALLVGINEYSKVRPLRGSLNDIAQIKQILIRDLEFTEDKIRVLTDRDATKEQHPLRLGLPGHPNQGRRLTVVVLQRTWLHDAGRERRRSV